MTNVPKKKKFIIKKKSSGMPLRKSSQKIPQEAPPTEVFDADDEQEKQVLSVTPEQVAQEAPKDRPKILLRPAKPSKSPEASKVPDVDTPQHSSEEDVSEGTEGSEIEEDESGSGTVVADEIPAKADTKKGKKSAASSKEAAPEIFKFYCVYCGQKLSANVASSGRTIHCPACTHAIQIPSIPE